MSFTKNLLGLLSVASFFTLITGCSSTGSYQSFEVYSKPIYGKVAKRTAEYEGIARNPVIIIHGFLGAKLIDPQTRKNVWGNFKISDNFMSISRKKIRDFAVPMVYGKPLKDLKGGAVVEGMMENAKVRVAGIRFTLSGYSSMIKILTDVGYCADDQPLPKGKKFKNLFPFAYDWRRDLPENSARLDRYIAQKKAYLQKQYKKYYGIDNYDVQFDVISHSMGGLLARYYLRYGKEDLPADGSIPKPTWAGSKHLDKVLIVGTPNGGYLDTVLEMVNGMQIEAGTPTIPPGILGTWVTYYQMMPPNSTRSVVYADKLTGKGVDIFDPKVWVELKWGLVDPKQDHVLKILLPHAKTRGKRRKIALDHLTKCLKRAKQFTDTMRIHANPPDDVKLFLFQGDAVKTTRKASVDRKTGKLTVIDYEPGDGKVLVSSTVWDERIGMKKWVPYLITPIEWTAVYRLTAAHMGITRMEVFADNMTWCLLVTQTPAQVRRRSIYKKYYEINW
jgi:pimeloyl-ACP methyl ester carboxylesterase